RWPGAPLITINRPEIAVLVCPFIPDRDAIFLQIGDVRIAFEEPEQFMDDRPEMQLLGGQNGKTLFQIETHLISENRPRARPRAVATVNTVIEHMLKKIEIGAHGGISRIRFGWTHYKEKPQCRAPGL